MVIRDNKVYAKVGVRLLNVANLGNIKALKKVLLNGISTIEAKINSNMSFLSNTESRPLYWTFILI